MASERHFLLQSHLGIHRDILTLQAPYSPPRHHHSRPSAAPAQLEGKPVVHQAVVLVGQVLEDVLPEQNTSSL